MNQLLNFVEGSIEGLAWVAEGSGVAGAKTLGYQAQITGALVPIFGTAAQGDSYYALTHLIHRPVLSCEQEISIPY